jgi:hypothetical protein
VQRTHLHVWVAVDLALVAAALVLLVWVREPMRIELAGERGALWRQFGDATNR